MNNVALAFLLTLFAGLSTGLGSLIAFLLKGLMRSFYLLHWDFLQV